MKRLDEANIQNSHYKKPLGCTQVMMVYLINKQIINYGLLYRIPKGAVKVQNKFTNPLQDQM